ncbi:virulence associated lipoprotein [Borrelia hispanica]|uniref:virulence associated lipoprotein n=1 Tax=Borrelia hispanica TaxID=40835 RepID=UPI000464F43D|nr:virulence associated lipoprotein [Borrelia hispanica]
MKKKVFIIFMLISLISLLLIACGQNGDNAEAQRKSEEEKARRAREEKRLEEEKPGRIAIIKNATSSEVKKVLAKHNDENWSDDTVHTSFFDAINAVFGAVPHKVVGQTEFLYNDATAGDRAKESKAARREVYLAFDYFLGSINAFGEFVKKLVETSALATKNKAKLKDLLSKIRKSAKAYYIDSYDTLEKKLSKLGSLSGTDVKSLEDNLDALETARAKLIASVVRPLKKRYSVIGNFLANSGSASVNSTADEIETYWDTDLSKNFNFRCNELIRIGGEIKKILDRAH